MNVQQLQRLWTFIGTVLVYYALNSWIVSQGGQEVFGAKLVVPDRVPAALIAIPICSVLLILTSSIGILYGRRIADPRWSARVPVAFFDSINPASKEGKIYQGVFLCLFSILPPTAVVHFWDVVLTAHIVSRDVPPREIPSMWNWSALIRWNDPARICSEFQKGPPITCEGSASILPGIEPWALGVLTALAFVVVVIHWLTVLWPNRPQLALPTMD